VIALIGDDIADVEWQIAAGLFKPEYQPAPLQSETAIRPTDGLSQNYPNPRNPTTTIHFQLSDSRHVTLTIFNLMGQKVRVLLDEYRQAGAHTVIWD
jgi:hypothetical protein